MRAEVVHDPVALAAFFLPSAPTFEDGPPAIVPGFEFRDVPQRAGGDGLVKGEEVRVVSPVLVCGNHSALGAGELQ